MLRPRDFPDTCSYEKISDDNHHIISVKNILQNEKKFNFSFFSYTADSAFLQILQITVITVTV